MAKITDITTNEMQGGAVMLPCSPDDFKDFISGLLGKPQTIDREIEGPFKVNRDNIRDLYHLLEQRVLSQNDGALMQFTARVIYDDNSSVLLNSIDDFMSYNEVKPLISHSLVVTWVFLLKFMGRKAPEKQTIDITFASVRSLGLGVLGVMSSDFIRFSQNHISLRVSHTDRSWGADIDSLLTGALERLTEHRSTVRKWVNRWGSAISVGVFLLFMSMSIWGVIESANRIDRRYNAEFDNLGQNPSQSDILVYISGAISEGAWTRFGLYGAFFVIISIGISLVFSIGIQTLAEHRQSSFVLLTEKSKDAYEKSKTSLRNNWIKLIGTAILSGFAGALGKYLFLVLTNFG